MPGLAIFDLDHTLLDGDSNDLWAGFLAERGALDKTAYDSANARYTREYLDGSLDIFEYLRFTLEPLIDVPGEVRDGWLRDFIAGIIRPRISHAARELLAEHRAAGDYLLVMTASNHLVTTPIGAELGVDELLGSRARLADGRATGEIDGTPCFRDGKVQRLRDWLAASGRALAGSHFYSDSANDIPLLELVERPVAVNPDRRLRAHAAERGWPTLRLRCRAPA